MALTDRIYSTFFKRNSVYVTSIFAGAFAFSIGFDMGVNAFWDKWNKGKQWKDIRGQYLTEGSEE